MENRSIKNRLYQTLANKSPKHPFLLEEDAAPLAPVLRPRKLQDSSSAGSLVRALPIFKQGRLVLNPLPEGEAGKRRPKEVAAEKLSRQAKSLIEQNRSRLRNNLRPGDIFQLYENFPEMLEDFFYLNRVGHPYDYQIVTYAGRNASEYMTISSQGVTLYHEKEAEFLTRQEWLADEARYHQLQRIYFFKQYKLCKNFRIWKNRMRRHYMREMTAVLNEHLFLAYPHPRHSLLAVRHLANTLKDALAFFPYEHLERLTAQDFIAHLDHHREHTLLKTVSEVTAAVTRQLEVAVGEEIRKFKLENSIRIEGVNESGGSKEGYVYSQEAILRKQYKRVYKLIKLADCMLQEAKAEMATRSLQQLLDKLAELHQEDREPWIACSAMLSASGQLTWHPDAPALTNLFLQAISKNVQVLNEQNERIASSPLFGKYRLSEGDAKPEEGRNSFKAMVEDSPVYHSLLAQIQTTLGREFSATQQEEGALQKFIGIYLRHEGLPAMGEMFSQNSGVELCSLVDQWKRDERDMQELPEDKKGKLLLYNYAELRRKIVLAPRQTLAAFFALLPEQTATRCRQLITECRALLEGISVYPTEIVSFARFSKAVREAAERLEDIRSAGSEICLLVELMGKNKLGNMELYNSRKVEALNAITALKGKVDESEARENESLSKFKKDNEAEVAKIKATVRDLSARFAAIDFTQTRATAKEMREILLKIREVLPPISQLESQSRKIQQIEGELSLSQTDFAEVHALFEHAQLVHEIWSCREEWKALLVDLYHKHYCDVDCPALTAAWQSFANRVATLAKAEPDNDILKNLAQELAEVEVLLETIVALRSPNLEEKAWREISEYLGYELGVEGDEAPFRQVRKASYTVKWLLEINIPVYKEKIEFIVRKAEKEKELAQQLGEYKNYLANLSFQTYQRKREVLLFGRNEQVKELLQSHLTQLYSILESHYSPPIKAEADTLIRHYEYVEEIMHAVMEFASNWERLESFFEGSAGSLKLLTKESKEFASWEAQWKKIVKSVTSDSQLVYRRVCDETTGQTPSRSTLKQIAKVNATLDQLRKGLDDYLDKKRAAFPRYYFLPDERLLRLLASADPAHPVTPALVPALYPNIARILYREEGDAVVGVVSCEGEEVGLKSVSFKLQSEMEDVLRLTEEQLRKRIGYLIRNVFAKYSEEELSRERMLLESNAQVALAVDLIAWGRLAEETYLSAEPLGDLYDWLDIQEQQIKELRALAGRPHERHVQLKLGQLMSQSLYLREKTGELLRAGVGSTDSYEWERLPKLTMANTNGDIFLKQLNNRLNYCYEFQANSALSFTLPPTERAWLALAHAVAARDTVVLQGPTEALRELAYLVAQQVETVAVGERSFKMVERFISGAVFTGSWVLFHCPATPQMLAFLANQLQQVRKALLDTSIPSLPKTPYLLNPSVSFFITLPEQQNCPLEALLSPLSHRCVSVVRPSQAKLLGMVAECWGSGREVGEKVAGVIQAMRECFSASFCLPMELDFMRTVLRAVIDSLSQYSWLQSLKCKQFYEFVTCEVLDLHLLPCLPKEDVKAYEALKSGLVTDYERIKAKQARSDQPSAVGLFLEQSKLGFLKRQEFVEQLELLCSCLSSSSLGVVVYGEALSGKTTLINLAAEFLQKERGVAIRQHRIYHNAYSREEVFGSSDKTQAILAQSLSETQLTNWVIFDGQISPHYLELFGRRADRYVVPQVGTLTPHPSLKLIVETYDISQLTPAIVGNHSLLFVAELLTADAIVRKMMVRLQARGLLVNLSGESVEWLAAGLGGLLGKLEARATLKGKLIGFAYPLSSWEISSRCCRLVEGVLAMNWESIREKDKNMRKLLERFVGWAAFWSLVGVVAVEDQPKLDKCITELCRTDTPFPEDLANCIIYPGCGLEVQPLNGLRTQSSLSIPEKGIITNVLRSDLLADDPKASKFYEEIVISEVQVIRVNCHESNRFNYLAQLSSFTATPLLLLGPPNTGKKSILELYAKNTRTTCQFHSIRYAGRQQLALQIEKPFRRVVGLQGVVLKSVAASRKLLVAVEDVALTQEEGTTAELLRMLFSEGGFHNRHAHWLRFTNCAFLLVARRLTASADLARLLPRLTVFQTAPNCHDKLQSIYAPYLANWSAFNGMSGELQRIFSSENGDTLLDATLAIYKLCQELHEQSQKTSLERELLRPCIGDVGKVLGYICRTPQASHYNLTYYYQLWAHEVVRVFGDRMRSGAHRERLFKEIKKEALVKFKENCSLRDDNMLSFSSLGIENENCYIRIEDPSYLHSYISNLLEADQISLPLKYLFPQLLDHLLRIYRVLSLEAAHLLLVSPNPQAAHYLVRLACQVGQNDCHSLQGQLLSLEKHIEPTLYYKDSVCLYERVECLSEDCLYQLACLLNGNVYDFALKGELREKVRSSLSRKDKEDKKEDKREDKRDKGKKADPKDQQQHQEDVEALMAEQFLNYAHLVLIGDPASPALRPFMADNPDIVGSLHFSWLLLPEESLVKVARQVVSFDQEINQLVGEGHCDQELIEKARRIHWWVGAPYFNDLLTVCEMVKAESARCSSTIKMRQNDLRAAQQNMGKVQQLIADKQVAMQRLQLELDDTNCGLDQKCSELLEINSRIADWQMNATSQELATEGLAELRLQQDEIEGELKAAREKKDALEADKKKLLKTLKIGRDYLEVVAQSKADFHLQLAQTDQQAKLLQDRLLIVWAAASYLLKVDACQWVGIVNSWLSLVGSAVPAFSCLGEVVRVMESVVGVSLGAHLFAEEVAVKLLSLLLLLHNYEETVHYGSLLKVYDPKGLLLPALHHIALLVPAYSQLRRFPAATRDNRADIDAACRLKNALVVVESGREVADLEAYLQEKKMVSYFSKIVVAVETQAEAHLTLHCPPQQMRLALLDLALRLGSPALHQEKALLVQQVGAELKRREEQEEQLFRACACINLETETYTEEVNRCRNQLATTHHSIALLEQQLQSARLVTGVEAAEGLAVALEGQWELPHVRVSHLADLYTEWIDRPTPQTTPPLAILPLHPTTAPTHPLHPATARWERRLNVLLVQESRSSLAVLEGEWRGVNLLTTALPALLNDHPLQPRVLFNFIPDIHTAALAELLDRLYLEEDSPSALLIMAPPAAFHSLHSPRFNFLQVQQPPAETRAETDRRTGWLRTLGKYLGKVRGGADHVDQLLREIERSVELTHSEDELLKLVGDLSGLPQAVARLLLGNPQAVQAAVEAAVGQAVHRSSQHIHSQVRTQVREELAFPFNPSEFLPTKDPLATEVIAECLRFNRRLREAKDRVREEEGGSEVGLNRQSAALRRTLVRLHVLPALAPTTKSSSHKTLSPSSLLQQVVRLPACLLTPKMLAMLRCRAARKLRVGVAQVGLQWRLCAACPEEGLQPDLCVGVQARLREARALLASWSRRDELQQLFEMVVCAVERQEGRGNQSLRLPILSRGRVVGQLEVGGNEVGDYVMGVEQPYLELDDGTE